MKRSLVALAFLFTLLVLASSASARVGNTTPINIVIDLPKTTDVITKPDAFNRDYAIFNITYRPITDNTVNWCRLDINGTQMGTNLTITAKSKNYFRNIALTNGTWWCQIQCRDNYSNYYNSTNTSVRVLVDVRAPVVVPSFSRTTYNTTIGEAQFKFTATDALSPIRNCTLYVEGEAKGYTRRVSNASLTAFAKITLPEGEYDWYVDCVDTVGNVGHSTQGLLIAELSTSMNITLNSPPNKAVDLDEYVTFKYTPSSMRNIRWCSLKLNDTVNLSSYDIENREVNSFEKVRVLHGPWNWSIQCIDIEDYSVNSSRKHWLWSNRTLLITEYLSVNVSEPFDGAITRTGEVSFKFVPTAKMGLDRCELVTNDSVRLVSNSSKSGQEVTLRDVSFSEGVWEWRIRCFDDSANEWNSDLRLLTVEAKKPEPIVEPPVEKIDEKVEENATPTIENQTTIVQEKQGLSNAVWVTFIVITIALGIAGVVIVTNKKLELELEKDLQLLLYKLKIRKDAPEAKKKHALTDERKKALKDYIIYHMKRGVARAKIEEHLRRNNWNNSHIKTVFDELEIEWDQWRDKFVSSK